GLSTRDRIYLQTLIQLESAKTLEEREIHAQSLTDLHPGKRFRTKEIDEFQVLSNSLHFTILSCFDLAVCDRTEKSIHRCLRKSASIHEVRSALERLALCGLIKRTEDGRYEKTCDWVGTRNDVASEGA